MSQKKLITLLSVCALSLLLLYLSSFFVSIKNKPKTISSALLNPGYLASVEKIQISHGDSCVTLSLEDDCWKGYAEEIVFPVQASTVNSFLEAASRVRTLHIISSNTDKRNLEQFRLEKGSAYEVSFFTQSVEPVSRIFFGANNYSGHRIYIRTEESPIYETEDDVYPWLETSARQWADMNLIPQSLLGKLTSSDIQRINIAQGKNNRTLFPDDASFAKTADTLLSLRGGGIVPAKLASKRDTPEAVVRVDTGYGGTATLRIYRTMSENIDVPSYVLLPEITAGSMTSRNDSAFSATSYALEISEWTFGRILEAMNY